MGVQFSMVSHSRVNNFYAVTVPHCVKDIGNVMDFRNRAKVAGIDGIKMNAFLLPMLLNGRNIIG